MCVCCSATGSAAVQIAKKIIGAKRVIGIAGGADKCAWVESLGADECIDYKSPCFEHELIRATEGFVDVYLDLVGGESEFQNSYLCDASLTGLQCLI